MSIRKIAKEAKVSTTTVSRVINNHPYVSDELRNKVLNVMAEINYIPNRNAINLSNGESHIIGVVVPYTRNSCYDQLVEGILEEATKQHKKVLMLPTYFNKELERDYYTLLRDKTVDGIIVTSKTHDDHFLNDLREYGTIVTTEKTTIDSVPAVYPDREQMYHEVFSYIKQLHQINHVFVTVNRPATSSLSTKIKHKVFNEYFDSQSIPHSFITDIYTFEDGYKLGLRLFPDNSSQIAIYCNGDEVAAGLFKAATQKQLQLNHDFFLIGEDNQLIGETLGIDTVDFNLKAVGAKAVRHLINNEITHEKNPCEFIKRNTD